jgi:hypothetical protein
MKTLERAPVHEQALTGNASNTTSWGVARERLANPENPRTYWLATVRPDGRPHLMPVIAFWIDEAFHLVVGAGTRKGRNLLADVRCALGTGSLKLPSLDIVAEGRAKALDDVGEVRRIAEHLSSNGWELEARGTEVFGPHAPTAGAPPYRIFRIVPTTVFGLPGMHGMDQVDPSESLKPTRWDFADD